MKIAISAKGAGLGAWFEPLLHECGYLMIVDDKGDFSAIENPRSGDSQKDENYLVEKATTEGVDVCIIGGISENAQKTLREHGVTIYSAEKGSILELVEQYEQGNLKLFG